MHAILDSDLSGNVITVMGCSPPGELLVTTSINSPVEVSSSLASSSWILTAGEHLLDPLVVSVLATSLRLFVDVLLLAFPALFALLALLLGHLLHL